MTKPLISIVIICKNLSEFFITKTLPAISSQTFSNWELLVSPDKRVKLDWEKTTIIPTWPKTGPADKKDIGIKKAKGEIVAFIDDDAYPDKDWLKNAIPYFDDEEIAAVCGPGITPPDDPLLNQVSGWFWSSYLGSAGAGTYRCWPGKIREVDDYPTFNLIVRKTDLHKVGGFDSAFWPGEDTKLCHDLVYRLGKKIIYDPKILVYHQRRSTVKAHLKQLGRYGLHRGHFVRLLPRTSKRFGYFLTAIFTVGVLGGFLLLFLMWVYPNKPVNALINFYLVCLGIYFVLDIINAVWVYAKSKSVRIGLLLIPITFISHLFYGSMFIRGLIINGLASKYDRNKL